MNDLAPMLCYLIGYISNRTRSERRAIRAGLVEMLEGFTAVDPERGREFRRVVDSLRTYDPKLFHPGDVHSATERAWAFRHQHGLPVPYENPSIVRRSPRLARRSAPKKLPPLDPTVRMCVELFLKGELKSG